MIANLIKRLSWVICLLSLLITVSAETYTYETIDIDKLLCGESYPQDYSDITDIVKLNSTSSDVFNKSFLEEATWWNFQLNRSWAHYPEIGWILLKNNTEYRIETDGAWFMLKATLKEKVDISNISRDYYYRSKDNVENIKDALPRALSDTLKLECRAGFDPHHSLLEIINIYEFPVNEHCSYESGDIFLDCSNDSFIQEFLNNIWGNPEYQRRREYRWGGDRVFIELTGLEFGRTEDSFKMTNPMIVLSDSEYVGGLTVSGNETWMTGRTTFGNHFEFLYQLARIPLITKKAETDIEKIEIDTATIYEYFEKVKNSWESDNINETKELIRNLRIDYEKRKVYLERLKAYQEEYYYDKEFLLTENPQTYYEDAYYLISKRYLAELNAKILILESKINILIDLQNSYDSFAANILADINSSKNAINALNNATWTLRITVLLAILLFIIDVIISSEKKENASKILKK